MKLRFIVSSLLLSKISAQTFTKVDKGCIGGSSDPNCPKEYEFLGGPGWTGDRLDWPVNMFCSPSCTNNNNPKECSLILAMHGIYSNPGDQIWLMMGSVADISTSSSLTFNEDESVGGPYCISFHKSRDVGWAYSCEGDDADHIEGFIKYALENFPIDPDAVNLHGFSSGAIQTNHMMNTRCSIEKYISAAAPYGAGWVMSPPTTKAAYLVAMGTHDEIVPYEFIWDYSTQTQYPTCACSKLEGADGCTGSPYYALQGERLAASIAAMRGYTGDIWGNSPSPTSQLDLITEDYDRCERIKIECYSLLENPNPWNEGYSCDNLEAMETDVIEYPISSDSDAGPVTLWRMNQHNHDYPNKRYGYGPTEFFMQLRKFFNDNRGRQSYPGTRVITEIGTMYVCNNPYSLDFHKPELIFRPALYEIKSADECKEACLNEKTCTEAFFHRYGCILHTSKQPCLSYSNSGYWVEAVHWKVQTIKDGPTASPTVSPTGSPIITDSPTKSPTLSPTETPQDYCAWFETLQPDQHCSFYCSVNGAVVGDYIDGYTTEAICNSYGGDWIAYDCQAALDYWLTITDSTLKQIFKQVYQPICCLLTQTQSPTVAPTSPPLCSYPDETLKADLQVSYSCSVNGENIGDFLDGVTTATSCADQGGDWTPYNCQQAEDYWRSIADPNFKETLQNIWYHPRCCRSSITQNPSASPTNPPTSSRTNAPTKSPTKSPTLFPTKSPSSSPTKAPISSPVISPTSSPTKSPSAPPVPYSGFQGILYPNDFITSPNGKIQLKFENNGNLVLYDENSNMLWSTDTAGIDPWKAVMNQQGILVVRDTDRNFHFSSWTNGNPGAALYVQDDGGLVIKDTSGTPLWDRYFGNLEGSFQGQLFPGDYITSPNGLIKLTFQTDGDLVLTDENANQLWSSNTAGIDPRAMNMQSDGNLVVYDTNGTSQFATKTSGNPGSKLIVQDDGYLVIKDASGTPLWDRVQGKKNVGFMGKINPNEYITSPNGKMRLENQLDGNVVIYNEFHKSLWSTDTSGIVPFRLIMNNQGNLILMDADRTRHFKSETHGNPGALLYLENDGNLVIKDSSGTPIWDRINGKGGFKGILVPNKSFTSPNWKFRLVFQGDGNLVLYDIRNSIPLWSTGTAGIEPWAVGMQPDGNLVVYDIDRTPRFATGTGGNPGALLYLQDDGNLVIKDVAGNPVWNRFDGKL